MPVSHLGLSVSNIPIATSFYLAALQPLGYRFVGKDGPTVGLGVDNADFFLTQDTGSTRISPSHVAFRADSRLVVRDCYTCALKAGARPSGAPAYCNDDNTAFNAAVEDLDGNTVEFIFRESGAFDSSIRLSQAPHATSEDDDRRTSVDYANTDGSDRISQPSCALIQAQTGSGGVLATKGRFAGTTEDMVVGLASKDAGSAVAFPSKALIGTVLGAAAGAAFAYAVHKSERESAKDEADFTTSVRQSAYRYTDALEYDRPHNLDEGRKSIMRAKSQHRNYSVTETSPSVAKKHRSRGAMATDDTDEGDGPGPVYYRSRHERALTRSSAANVLTGRTSNQSSQIRDMVRQPIQRASTFANDGRHYYIEAVPHASSSSSSRRTTTRLSDADDTERKRRDSAVSVHSSHRSHHSHHSQHSHHSERSHRSHRSHRSRQSSVNTPRSSRHTSIHYDEAAEVPLPPSRGTSYYSANEIPLPPSEYGHRWDDDSNESYGSDDASTVVPDDSISCVDFSGSRRRARSHHRSARPSETASAYTVRHSEESSTRLHTSRSHHSGAMSLPVRSRPSRSEFEDRRGKRTAATDV